jgi:undecaprenyl pyrophosphate phosphatase UppP
MFRALVLGVVQGFTEFVPISSSAHLVLVPFVLGWETPDLPFDVAVHIGTGLAVVAYFWRELVGLAAGTVRSLVGRADVRDQANARLTLLLAVGSVPAAIAGLFLQGLVEGLTDRPEVVAALLVGTAGILLLGEEVYRRRAALETRDMTGVRAADAVLVGLRATPRRASPSSWGCPPSWVRGSSSSPTSPVSTSPRSSGPPRSRPPRGSWPSPSFFGTCGPGRCDRSPRTAW